MKDSIVHLCLTQSPLITMVFQGAMKEMGVPADQIRSVSRRSVLPAGEGRCLDDLSDRLEAAYKGFRRGEYRRLQEELRRQIDEITGSRGFLAYIPHTQRLMYQEILAHPKCLGYLFVEEGFTSMSWKGHQAVKAGTGKRLQYRLRSAWTGSSFRFDREMFDVRSKGFRGAIAISKHAFTGMEKVTDVSKWIRRYEPQGQPKRVFAVLDTCYLHRGIRWDDYADALVEAVNAEAAPETEVFIKFHFVDTEAEGKFAALKKRIQARTMTLLPREFSVEDALSADDRLLFGVSSMGYYVAIFGGSVRCFAPAVKELDVGQWIAKGGLPGDFREIVGLPEGGANR